MPLPRILRTITCAFPQQRRWEKARGGRAGSAGLSFQHPYGGCRGRVCTPHGARAGEQQSAQRGGGRQALGLARDCGSRGGGVGSRWLIRCHISSTPAVGRPALHETYGSLTGARRPTSVLFLSRGTVVNPNRPCWALDAARGKLLRRLSGADGVSCRRLMCPSVPRDVRSHRLSDRSQD
jgi:hypothetical protein